MNYTPISSDDVELCGTFWRVEVCNFLRHSSPLIIFVGHPASDKRER